MSCHVYRLLVVVFLVFCLLSIVVFFLLSALEGARAIGIRQMRELLYQDKSERASSPRFTSTKGITLYHIVFCLHLP